MSIYFGTDDTDGHGNGKTFCHIPFHRPSPLNSIFLINLEEAQKIGSIEKLLEDAGFDENQGIFSLRKESVSFTPIEVAI